MNKGYFESTGNTYSHVEGYKTTKLKYNKKQVSVLNIGMLTAGIGFLYLAALGFILEYNVFLNLAAQQGGADLILISLSSVGIIVGFILSLIWSFRVQKASIAFGIITILVYTTSYAIGFGSLFAYLNMVYGNESLLLIMSVFGFVGLIFIGTFAVTKLMSLKTFINFSKIIMVASIIGIISLVVLLILSMFLVGEAYRVTFIISSVVGIIMSVLFLAYDLWLAQNMDKFFMDDSINLKMGLFIGFQILMNIIILIFNLLRLLMYVKK